MPVSSAQSPKVKKQGADLPTPTNVSAKKNADLPMPTKDATPADKVKKTAADLPAPHIEKSYADKAKKTAPDLPAPPAANTSADKAKKTAESKEKTDKDKRGRTQSEASSKEKEDKRGQTQSEASSKEKEDKRGRTQSEASSKDKEDKRGRTQSEASSKEKEDKRGRTQSEASSKEKEDKRGRTQSEASSKEKEDKRGRATSESASRKGGGNEAPPPEPVAAHATEGSGPAPVLTEPAVAAAGAMQGTLLPATSQFSRDNSDDEHQELRSSQWVIDPDANMELVSESGPDTRSPSPSPRRMLHGTFDSASPIIEFGQWAHTGKWELIREAFLTNNNLTYGGVLSHRHLTIDEWSQLMRSVGYPGDPDLVFHAIAHECRNEKEDKQRAMAGINAYGTISFRQVKRFQARAIAMTASLRPGVDGSPVGKLTKQLIKLRGTVLRGWRLDLDLKGNGKVSYIDLAAACRQLGHGAGQARQIWSSLRPDNSSVPIHFHEIAPQEAENLENFAELLWLTVGFDIDKAWALFDVNNQKVVNFEEFIDGSRRLNFNGNIRMIFKGLDTSGLGRIWRNEFEYLHKVSRLAQRKLHEHSRLFHEFITWVQRDFSSVEDLIQKLGISTLNKELTVGDFAARLTALGFGGNSLQVALRAARYEKGTSVSAGALYFLLSNGKRPQIVPSSGANKARDSTPKSPGSLNKSRSIGRSAGELGWKNTVDNISDNNLEKPSCARAYFSSPRKSEGDFRQLLRKRQPSMKDPQAGHLGSVTPPQSARNPRTQDRRMMTSSSQPRPAWNDSLWLSTECNTGLPSKVRAYFSDPNDKPTKKRIQAEVHEKSMSRALSQDAVRFRGRDGRGRQRKLPASAAMYDDELFQADSGSRLPPGTQSDHEQFLEPIMHHPQVELTDEPLDYYDM